MAGKTKQIGKSPEPHAEKGGAPFTSSDERSDSLFAAKAKDLGALREAVVDAAGVGAGLWLSYLFLFFYLFIAVAAVTHRDLLFENPVKLPFLNVELPLLGFFVLGPLLFLVLDAYVLLHFAILAGKVGVFDTELRAQIRDDDTRTRLRRQLPSNIFVQYLAGPYEVRTGFMGFMLSLIALISLVLFPIALLVFFQLQFLPYHNALVTWWHRIAVLLGILLLWMFWPSIARGQATWLSWHDFRRRKIITLLLASLVPLLLGFTIATFPGEWLQSNLSALPLVPTKWPALGPQNGQTGELVEGENGGANKSQVAEEKGRRRFWPTVSALVESMEWTSLHELLVAGDIDLVARKPTSLWSNRLVLPDIDVVDYTKFDSEEKIEALRETLSLRGRHLEGAVLVGSDLRKADFTAARLQGAKLWLADLRDAKFGCAIDPTARDPTARPKVDCTQLQGADLSGARLQGADFEGAQLQRADLPLAHLQGANLSGARLQGAVLDFAQLYGARLDDAQLQGADLSGVQLQGADLRGAQLQGAWLKWAHLQGANLSGARLQGADLSGAQLEGADLTNAEIWLARFPDGVWDQSPVPIGLADLKTSPPAADDKAELERSLRASVTNSQLLERLIDYLDPILRDDPPKWDDEASWSGSSKAKEPSPDELARYLASMACSERNETAQRAITEALVWRAKTYTNPSLSIRSATATASRSRNYDYAKPMLEALLEANCKGAKTLTEEIRATLESLD